VYDLKLLSNKIPFIKNYTHTHRERERERVASLVSNEMRMIIENNHYIQSMRMSTEDVIEEYKLFNFAGMEITSVLLTWMLILLGIHLDWQDRAREEVLSIFGKDKTNFDSLSRLKCKCSSHILSVTSLIQDS
jgi:hypothetical protein